MNTQQNRKLPYGKFRKHQPITPESPFNFTTNTGLDDEMDAMRVFGGMMFWRNGHPNFFEPSRHVQVALARENLLRTFLQIPVEEYRA